MRPAHARAMYHYIQVPMSHITAYISGTYPGGSARDNTSKSVAWGWQGKEEEKGRFRACERVIVLDR
jgi:hypothetical protein